MLVLSYRLYALVLALSLILGSLTASSPALAFADCPLIGTLENFEAVDAPYLRTYDAQEFKIVDGDETKTVVKQGHVCKQDYDLKSGLEKLSGVEIMQNYAEGLPSLGFKITNTQRAEDDEIFATTMKGGVEYWAHVWESNGDGLHIEVLTVAPFKGSVVAATDKDCPFIPVHSNFESEGNDYYRNYDVAPFAVANGDNDETVEKYGEVCSRDYDLKPGIGRMSALDIMRNYADAAQSVGYTIVNTHRAEDDGIFATMTKDGAEYWFDIHQSNGDVLHIESLKVQPFRASVSALGPKDCPLTPAIANFQAGDPPTIKKFDAADFKIVDGDQEKTVTKKGQSCQQDYELKPDVKRMSALEIMLNYAQALPAAGLTITNTHRDPDGEIFATLAKDGVETWVHVWESNGDGLHAQTLQIGAFKSSMKAAVAGDATPTPAPAPAPSPTPAVAAITLAPPAATPEDVKPESGDFPYLPPLPGSVLTNGRARTEPFYVQPGDAKAAELVAKGSIVKAYTPPPGVTPEQVAIAYRAALLKAKWTLVAERKAEGGGDSLTAHYGLNGRNIWAILQIGEKLYVLEVADATVGEAKLEADLGAQCHLALTGVLFDFNKSKLKPESDAILEQVAAVMTKQAGLKLEVQGHTDGVGSQEFNLPLSKARAHSVVAWLTDHGVAGGRLDAQGFGKLKPVASNDTDEGRAQNRRVEIANKACKSAEQ